MVRSLPHVHFSGIDRYHSKNVVGSQQNQFVVWWLTFPYSLDESSRFILFLLGNVDGQQVNGLGLNMQPFYAASLGDDTNPEIG